MTAQSGAALGEPAGLAGPVAVTGAASGIGLGVARALVVAGAQVILSAGYGPACQSMLSIDYKSEVMLTRSRSGGARDVAG